MTTTNETPQVWIACLAAYNAGCLHGKWVDATDADEMYEAAAEIIKTSPAWRLNGHAEEWAIHDYNAFPDAVVRDLGEYASFETVANVGRGLEEHGKAFAAWLSAQDSISDLAQGDLGEQFQEHYRGEWDSEEAYAQNLVIDDGLGWAGVSAEDCDLLASYIDWETIARELFQHGNYTYADGYVFEDEV